MKKYKVKDSFLAELRKIPIIQVACEKVGLSRNSVYRWKNEDKTFYAEIEKALQDGEALVNDMSESQLLIMIKEKNWSAISFWLRHRNPKYRDRVEIGGTINTIQALSPEERESVRKSLLSANITLNNHE